MYGRKKMQIIQNHGRTPEDPESLPSSDLRYDKGQAFFNMNGHVLQKSVQRVRCEKHGQHADSQHKGYNYIVRHCSRVRVKTSSRMVDYTQNILSNPKKRCRFGAPLNESRY